MNPTLFASLRSLLADPDRLDRDALFAVLDDDHASEALACLAPSGSLAQIAAALRSEWAWDADGWERHADELVGLITDPRCPSPRHMIVTWSNVPGAVGVLRDRTDNLFAWAQQRLDSSWYSDLATLLGPSDESVRLLMRSSTSEDIGRTLRLWSMATDPDDPTAWQAMIDLDMRAALHQRARSSWAFPAWGWDNAVFSNDVLNEIVVNLVAGWSPDHPSIRGRVACLEHHVTSNLNRYDGKLALVSSIGRSDALAEVVCARILQNHWDIWDIVYTVPWSRLHPRIQTVIDETMRQASDRWKRTWACAIGQAPVKCVSTIDADLLLWRIAPERWNDRDPSIRVDLVSRISDLPHHCYGWGAHPDLVARWGSPKRNPFRFWNPNVPPDDLRAWAYADRLLDQTSLQDVQEMIALLMTLPPDRRTRFEPIIDGRLGGRPEATAQPPWEWATWASLPATERQKRLRERLAVLRGNRTTSPAVRFWRARNDGLATLAMMVGEVLGLDDPSPILAALLAQIPTLRGNETDVGPSLPFPDDLDAARRAQITRLPLARDAQAYAAWCLWLLARSADVGADLIALHPTVAVALAPFLSPAQQKAVAASPAAQGWESVTHLRWVVACASVQEPPMPPIQRRIG